MFFGGPHHVSTNKDACFFEMLLLKGMLQNILESVKAKYIFGNMYDYTGCLIGILITVYYNPLYNWMV